jgi:hypothetical protein
MFYVSASVIRKGNAYKWFVSAWFFIVIININGLIIAMH